MCDIFYLDSSMLVSPFVGLSTFRHTIPQIKQEFLLHSFVQHNITINTLKFKVYVKPKFVFWKERGRIRVPVRF